MGGFWESVEGFVQHPVTRTTIGRDGPSITQTTHTVVAAKLRRVRRVSRGESSFLMAYAGIPYKITVSSPVAFTMNAYAPGVTDKVYPTRAALAHDLAPIIRGELLKLVEEGVPYIQIDAPQYTQLADPVPSGAGEAGRLGSGLGHR